LKYIVVITFLHWIFFFFVIIRCFLLGFSHQLSSEFSYRRLSKRHFLFYHWILLDSQINWVSFKLLNEPWIWINLIYNQFTFFRLLFIILKIWLIVYLYFLSKYARTIVALRLTPAIQWTSTFVYFLAFSIKS